MKSEPVKIIMCTNGAAVQCDGAPDIDDVPFWIYEDAIYSTYDPMSVFAKNILGDNEKDLLRQHVDYVKNFDERQHSIRFENMHKVVRVEIDHNTSDTLDRNSAYNQIYRSYTVIDPCMQSFRGSEDSVESTIAELFRRGNPSQPISYAPISNFAREKREIFCVRLDLAEPVDGKPGWQEFATRIMDMSHEDIQLLDECRCQYWFVMQVVELVLYHWCKLHDLKSSKIKLHPSTDSIRQVLLSMEKIDLLHRLQWCTSSTV